MKAARIDALNLSSYQVNDMVLRLLGRAKKLEILNPRRLNNALFGLKKGELLVQGNVGDFVALLNKGAKITVRGSAGAGLGSYMERGVLLVEGSADDFCGSYMKGGTIVVRGSVGNYAGMSAKGGLMIVGGNAGNFLGACLRKGVFLVLGNTGLNTGHWMSGGAIFVAGICRSLGFYASMVEATESEKERMELLLKRFGLSADLSALKKVVPREAKKAAREGRSERGERRSI